MKLYKVLHVQSRFRRFLWRVERQTDQGEHVWSYICARFILDFPVGFFEHSCFLQEQELYLLNYDLLQADKAETNLQTLFNKLQ